MQSEDGKRFYMNTGIAFGEFLKRMDELHKLEKKLEGLTEDQARIEAKKELDDYFLINISPYTLTAILSKSASEIGRQPKQ